MKLLLSLILILCISPVYGANRLKTWIAETLTFAQLNSEFDNIYIGTIDRTAGRWGNNDDIPIFHGTSQDARLEWDTTQATDSVIFGLGAGRIFSIMELADMTTDWGIASQTNPTLFVHSADAAATTDFISFTHDQTNAVIDTGTGSMTFLDDVIFQGTTPTITIGDGGTEDTQISFDADANDWYVCRDDTDDDFKIGRGDTCGTTTSFTLADNTGASSFEGDMTINGTTPSITIGDGGAEDETIFLNANANDWYICRDDTDDDFKIGRGSTCGSTASLTLADNTGDVTFEGTITLAGLTYTWPGSGEASGEQLQTNGSGTLTWETAGSLRAWKENIREWEESDRERAFKAVLGAPLYDFNYIEGRGFSSGKTYSSVMQDEAPWATHFAGVLDPVTTFGYTVASIQVLNQKVEDLKYEIDLLRSQ